MDRQGLLDLIPAYALGALDEEERTAVEALLATDPEAQALLADYRATTDRLVITTPSRLARPELAAQLYQQLIADKGRTAAPTRRRVSWRRYALLAAAVLAVVIAAGALLLSNRDSSSKPAAERLYEQLIEQQGARRVALNPGENQDKLWGDVVISAQGNQAVICVWELPPLDESHAFQLWLTDQTGGVSSGGVFQVRHPAGAHYIEVPVEAAADAYKAFGVSIEPSSGSPYGNRPSGPRVFNVLLSS